LLGFALKISPERAERLTTFRNPEKYQQSSGYQLYNSILALGSGGSYGQGLNQSRLKEAYLPEAHTDFILAVTGEEFGFTGIAAIIFLYIILISSAVIISLKTYSRQEMLLAAGIGMSLGLHAFVNIGVISGFLPTTGITAPFISYGGSSMLVNWLCIGILGNIARRSQLEDDVDMEDVMRQKIDEPFNALPELKNQ
jgi:cell division protein FtsW